MARPHFTFIAWIGAVVALAIGLLAPVSYGVVEYNRLAVTTTVTATDLADRFDRFVSENPDSWMLLGDRVKFLLEEQRASHVMFRADEIRISVADRRGTVVAASGSVPVPPRIVRKVPVFDFGTAVGTMEVEVSAQPLVVTTAVITGISAILAVLVFFPLRILPQRAFERTAEELAETRNVLILHEARRIEALGNLAGGMAHELNNMLLPIVSLTNLVRKSLPEGERNRARLDKVIEAAERASSIVASVLEFSRMRQTEARQLDLAAVVAGGLDVIRNTAPKTAEIRTQFADQPCLIHGNDQQIQSILVHLVTNAVEALAGKPGQITVGVDVVRVNGTSSAHSQLPAGAYAQLSVADTGVGMDEETQKRLFDPFFTTKEVGEGVGMGLAVVHGIAEQHGGTITVDSALGRGSTFHVLLPLVEA